MVQRNYLYQIRLARIASVFIGLLAIALTFYYGNLLDPLKLNLALYVTITVVPFILAIFGFQGTSCTTLISMATGILTILNWNKWTELSTAIDGSFLAMLDSYGLEMIAAHIFKQPEGAGADCVGLDNECIQIKQVHAQ